MSKMNSAYIDYLNGEPINITLLVYPLNTSYADPTLERCGKNIKEDTTDVT